MGLLVKGATAFTQLTDTPSSLSGETKKILRVNAGETAMELVDNEAALTFVIDGGGSAITTGEKGHLVAPFACEIESVEMEADQSGDIKVDIWKDTYANFPPTDADTICGGNEPEMSSAQKDQDATLTGWTTAIAEGDILAYNVDSCTTITRCTITLHVKKT
ncbi:hypothetical protein ES703_35408 [subsurface metagenome]